MNRSPVKDPIARELIGRLERRLKEIEDIFSQVVRNASIVARHSDLQRLSYSNSGHTGFASSADLTAQATSLTTHTGDSAVHATGLPVETYTPTNVTTTRSFDADAPPTNDVLADVLGTLIADLQSAGILD